ncbi:hypothetical protein PHISP_05565 [Aspergillus sp. HF37]|nr:hypothetical protein PHISP_05565 [Aspergillus sp. HF37]
MDAREPLRGSCSCGRNQYLIQIPENVTDHAHVYFDASRGNRRLHGAPLTAWLRVPLSWYQSHTRSYFPDETHSSIRRTFVPHNAPHTQRIFCGFCGTPLTAWTEDPREESDYMSVTIGSLFGDHQRLLDDLDLLPEESDEEISPTEDRGVEEVRRSPPSAASAWEVALSSARDQPSLSRRYRRGNAGGIPWFEEMVEGSRLGRLLKGRRGMGLSDDRSTAVEWEVSEMRHDDSDQQAWAISSSSSQVTGKRKQGRQSEPRETRSTRRRTGSS